MSEAGPGQLLFGFVRHWSRRATASELSAAENGRMVMVTEAVAVLEDRAEPTTVNAISKVVGLDQSGGSRLVKSAVGAGHLTLIDASTDGRRREFAVTPHGHALLAQAHEWQEQVFAELTAGWSEQRREDFQAAMVDLIARSYEINR